MAIIYITFFAETYLYSDGIAVDTLSRIVYYTGNVRNLHRNHKFVSGFIMAMTLDGQHKFFLVTMHDDVPRDIVLDPIRR